MTWRRVALALLGLVVGSGAALAVLLLTGDGPQEGAAASSTTTSTTTSAPAAWWFDETEIPLGPTVLVLEDLTVEDGEAVLSYSLYDLNPTLPGQLRESDGLIWQQLQRLAEEPVVAPEAWTLLTEDGQEISGATSSPRARSVTFTLPGDTPPAVRALRLDRYWMRLPYAYEIGLPLARAVTLDNGYVLQVGGIVEDTDSRRVQVDWTTGGGFAISTDPGVLMLTALGESWTHISGRTVTGLQLTHGDTSLPDPIRLYIRSAYWVPFERPIEIDAGALLDG